MVEYLKMVEPLAENLMDFGCAKCFGAQVDFSLQSAALKEIESQVGERLKSSIAVATNLAAAETRRSTAGPPAEQKPERAAQKTGPMVRRSLVTLIILGFSVLFILSGIAVEESERRLGLLGIGLPLLVYGCLRLVKRGQRAGPRPT